MSEKDKVAAKLIIAEMYLPPELKIFFKEEKEDIVGEKQSPFYKDSEENDGEGADP